MVTYELYSRNYLNFINHEKEQLALGIRIFRGLPYVYLILDEKLFEQPSPESNVIEVQFDNHPSEEIEYVETYDHDPNMVEIRLPLAFVKKMKAAHYLKMAPKLLEQGPLVASFDVSGFDGVLAKRELYYKHEPSLLRVVPSCYHRCEPLLFPVLQTL